MLSTKKALYQVKQIIDYLPNEEYNLIPQETIDYIEDNFEYDESIIIDPDIPLENQSIDDKAYELLDKIIKETQITKEKMQKEKAEVKVNNIEEDSIRLNNLAEELSMEKKKISKAKDLIEEYKCALKQKDDEIVALQNQNEQLRNNLQKIPKFIRKLFIKEKNVNLLTK